MTTVTAVQLNLRKLECVRHCTVMYYTLYICTLSNETVFLALYTKIHCFISFL